MSTPVPAERRLMHTRHVSCRGYERGDGLYEIESTLVDIKPYPVHVGDRGTIEPGEPFHEMRLQLVIDIDLNIREAAAETVHGPYIGCAPVAAAYARLAGMSLRSGFIKEARALLGGTAGCTHLTELLGPTVTTAMQMIWHVRDRLAEPKAARGQAAAKGDPPPPELEQCGALRRDGEAVRVHYPVFHIATTP